MYWHTYRHAYQYVCRHVHRHVNSACKCPRRHELYAYHFVDHPAPGMCPSQVERQDWWTMHLHVSTHTSTHVSTHTPKHVYTQPVSPAPFFNRANWRFCPRSFGVATSREHREICVWTRLSTCVNHAPHPIWKVVVGTILT